jgi:SAM-dependent methyltransferase
MIVAEISTKDDGWVGAGEAWGHAAIDWAYLFEPYARDAIEHLFDELGVHGGTELFDMACGSGYALGRAERRGARTTGLDASAALIEIADRRAPNSELRVGSMFDLPFADERFDAVTSFNGVWGGCQGAFHEAYRVMKPGARFGVTFWGPGHSLDLRDFFIAIGTSTPVVRDEMIQLATIGAPGVVESFYETAGFVDVSRGATAAVLEFSDAEHAWRTLRSPGIVLPALELVGEDVLRKIVLESLAPFRANDGSYRLVNELTHAVGTKPA